MRAFCPPQLPGVRLRQPRQGGHPAGRMVRPHLRAVHADQGTALHVRRVRRGAPVSQCAWHLVACATAAARMDNRVRNFRWCLVTALCSCAASQRKLVLPPERKTHGANGAALQELPPAPVHLDPKPIPAFAPPSPSVVVHHLSPHTPRHSALAAAISIADMHSDTCLFRLAILFLFPACYSFWLAPVNGSFCLLPALHPLQPVAHYLCVAPALPVRSCGTRRPVRRCSEGTTWRTCSRDTYASCGKALSSGCGWVSARVCCVAAPVLRVGVRSGHRGSEPPAAGGRGVG